MGRLTSVSALLEAARYEVIPAKGAEEKILAHIPPGRTVTVTASPAKGLGATIELARTLAGHGYRVVPHLSARLVVDRAHLTDLVQALLELGVDDVFVPAGDARAPAGAYASSLSVLEELDALGRPFPRIGITGYPESHPSICDDVTVQAMWDKRRYATYIVSNLCFDPAAFQAWVRRVRARGVTLPILMGLAGPVDNAKLLGLAAKIGVSTSARMLTRHGNWFLRFVSPGGYSPDRLLGKLAGTLSDPEAGVTGLHIYTFNQIAETERWRRSLAGTPDPARRAVT